MIDFMSIYLCDPVEKSSFAALPAEGADANV